MKEEDMREIMRKYREVKNLKLRFYLNNTRNEATIFIIFLDYTRLKSFGKNYQNFLSDAFQSYYNIFQVN